MADGLHWGVDKKVLRRIIEETPERVSEFMDSLAEGAVNDIVLSFGTGPTGRTYKRGKKKKHVASAPPGPPAVDTDALRGGMRWTRKGESRYVHDSVDYGVYQELGTSRMAPRPFVGPVFEATRRDLGKLARDFGIVKK